MTRLLAAIAAAVVLIVPGVATASTLIHVKSATLTSNGHDCDTTEWHFVITQVGGTAPAPSSIQVTWANGQTATVALQGVTGGTAHYRTTLNLSSTVTDATATIDSSWSGQFNLSHGPCGASQPTPTKTPTPTLTPTATNTHVPTATKTPTPTKTPKPDDDETKTPTPTKTPKPDDDETKTPTPTKTPKPDDDETKTPTPTKTPKPDDDETKTPTPTKTPVPEDTKTPTPTPTATNTVRPVPSATAPYVPPIYIPPVYIVPWESPRYIPPSGPAPIVEPAQVRATAPPPPTPALIAAPVVSPPLAPVPEMEAEEPVETPEAPPGAVIVARPIEQVVERLPRTGEAPAAERPSLPGGGEHPPHQTMNDAVQPGRRSRQSRYGRAGGQRIMD
jgi:hypothetical protein